MLFENVIGHLPCAGPVELFLLVQAVTVNAVEVAERTGRFDHRVKPPLEAARQWRERYAAFSHAIHDNSFCFALQ